MLCPSLTAPLYIAENNQEQIANLDGAIFKLNPDTQWFIYPSLLIKKKNHTYKKNVKKFEGPFSNSTQFSVNSHLATKCMDMISFTKRSVSKKEIKAIRFAA